MEIKNKNMFKSKKGMIIHLVLFVIVLGGFIYLGTLNFDENLDQNEIFVSEFKNVPLDNVFDYASAREIYAALDETNVILLGSKLNDWTEDVAILLNEVCIENDIEEIMYYDFFDDRNKNNGNYELVVEKLSNELYTLDDGTKELLAPTVIIVKDGDIIYYNDETGYMRGDITPDKYWSENKKYEFKANLEAAFKIYLGE